GAWQTSLGQRWTPLLLKASVGGELMALGPFAQRPGGLGTLSFLGVGTGDYLAPLAAPAWGAAATQAFLDALLEGSAGWHLLDLPGIPAESAALGWLIEAACARQFEVQVLADHDCPEVRIQGTWEQYFAGQGGH